MKDFEDIKALWKVQQSVPFDYKEIGKALGEKQRAYHSRLLLQTCIALLLLVFVLGIWILQPFSTWTTHLSMLLLSACLAYFISMQVKDYRKSSSFARHLLSPQEFIVDLKAFKQESFLLCKRNYTFYTLGIGLAFLFILFELYFILPLWLLLLFGVLGGLWFLFSYHFLLQAYLESESRRLNEMIAQLEKIQEQLNDE